MSENPILASINDNPMVHELLESGDHIGNLSEMEEALILASAFEQDRRTRIIVKKNKYEAQQLYSRLAMLEQEVLLFVMDDSLRVSAIAASPEENESQVAALCELRQDYPKLVITNTAAFMRYLPDRTFFDENCLTLREGQDLPRDELEARLNRIGYARTGYCEQPGTFASRGGILDIYSMNYPDPIRIEFFDTEIESIRFFSPQTQRTIRSVNEATIVPASTILFTDEQLESIQKAVKEKLAAQLEKTDEAGRDLLTDAIEEDLRALESYDPQNRLYRYYAWTQPASLLDYVDGQVIFSPAEGVEESAKNVLLENASYMQEEVQDFQALPKYTMFHVMNDLEDRHSVLRFHQFADLNHPIDSGISTLEAPTLNYLEWIPHEAARDNVWFALEKEDISLLASKMDISPLRLTDPIFYQGFETDRYTVYTRREIFRHLNRHIPYQKTFNQSTALSDILELEAGDYIVHARYGIGQYLGIVTREQNGVKKDYLHVVYRGGDDLYIPVAQFQLIRKYVSKEGAGTKLSRLGSGEWEKTKAKVSARVEEIAGRLVDLYAARSENIGFAYPKDDALEREFDEAFEYESTPDQIKATAEIKAEMEKPKPMDHLLIGDVGYGKTEVAMRCAFKAICAGKQVAFLAPTTILSMQHYETLKKRFEPTGARIALVNRFVSAKEMKKIREDLESGQIDIVVGTHRLLSDKIRYKDLGFLIIDEEQRFGVAHKEKIKEMRNSIDVLALSATPIPRTLQMSLIGVRTISQLSTPPAHRHPIQTYVMAEKPGVVKEIIQRELSRSGQVFFLHNRVEDIYAKARQLRDMFPDVSIGVAHGRMSRNEIEDVMLDFAQSKYDILVCTTIIETGLDIANANTIIIENADRFGLSQLYQIRGRVGRRERLAYCYLMLPEGRQIGEDAAKRLKSIKEFTRLGSGYKIAMRDLTIRGAGDMLGPKQAGFIDSVGLDMYLDMLSEAIARKQGKAPEKEEPEETPAVPAITTDGYIPAQFASSDGDKLSLYQQIKAVKNKKQLEAMEEKTADLFGRIPEEVRALFNGKRIELMTRENDVESLSENHSQIQIVMSPEWSAQADGLKLFEAMSQASRQAQMTFKNGRIQISFEKKKNYMPLLSKIMDVLQDPAFRKEKRHAAR